MLKATAFANAAAVVGAGLFVVCRLLVGMMPQSMFNIAQSWMHSVALQPSMMMGGYGTASGWLTGLVSMVVVVWLVAYAFAALYNSWAK